MAIFNNVTMKTLRLALNKTQQEMADALQCSRSFYANMERGSKPISDEKDALLRELELEYKKSQKLSRDNLESLMLAKELGDTLTTEQTNSMYADAIQLKEQFNREQKALLYTITQTRKAQDFTPSLSASIDKISLVVDLTPSEADNFYNEFAYSVGVDARIEYTKKVPTLKDYEHLFIFNEVDGKIVVKFVTLDKTGSRIQRLVMEYNPNKVTFENEFFKRLTKYFNPLRIKVRKLDVCKDYVGVCNKDVITFETGGKPTQTLESKYGSKTLYFGDMNKNGVRVYDKRGELKEVDKKEIAYECTRYEYRLTLPRYSYLKSLNTELPTVSLPRIGVLNRGITEAVLGQGLLVEDVYLIKGIYKGDISLNDLTSSNRIKFANVFEALKVEVMGLDTIEIRDAIIKYFNDYTFHYKVEHMGLEMYKEFGDCVLLPKYIL
ncbi:helix-turn-helix transcriptional regulator [Salmonella enterica]|nr:helix-turn-helix transcriptional regulator [Salmonella enterica]